MNSSVSNPAEYRFLTGLIKDRGWPLTKAAYVKALEHPFDPTFPLDAETVARVPPHLPGPIPRSPMDLLFSIKPVKPQPPVSSPSPSDARRLDPSLVTSVSEAYGLTLEQAEQRLKDFGG